MLAARARRGSGLQPRLARPVPQLHVILRQLERWGRSRRARPARSMSAVPGTLYALAVRDSTPERRELNVSAKER